MKYFKAEMQKKSHHAVISFHAGLLTDWTRDQNGQLRDEHGEYPDDYNDCPRNYPQNFKPYFASIHWQEGLPIFLPYETKDKYSTVMLVRHGHSAENKEIEKAKKAQRDAKKANGKTKQAKNSTSAASKKGVTKAAPKNKES